MVRDMILTEEGDLFVSVARQGVARYSLGRVSIYGPGQGLTDREIYQFGLDAAARVWAAGRGGLSTWDGSGWTPVRLEGAALGARDYTAVSHDPEGGTYLGSSDGVIIALTRDSFLERQLPAHGPERKIGLVAAGGGAVYLAGLKAVYRYDGEFTPIELPGSWFEGTVTGLLPERGGGLWLSTRFGILHYTGSVWEVFDRRQGLPTENFTCAAAGERGELWFGTFDRGVLRLTAEGWVHYRRTHGLPDERITSMAAGRPGTIWVSTVSGRVAGFNGKSWETLDIVEPSEPARPALPPADSVLFDDPSVRLLPQQGSDLEGSFPPVIGIDGSGRCMFCTTEGVYFQSEAGWRLIDTPAVRSGVRPTALRGTIDGNIWLGTSGAGVFCLTGGEWLHVDSTTGLGSDNVLSIEEDRSGTVWIGTMDGGVTRYRSGVR
jgi:ligand-binding sensor domain-containing protein